MIENNVECYECNSNLEEGDSVYVCEECGEVFCEDCKEEHKCFELDYEENRDCANCQGIELDMYYCQKCEQYFCEDCKEEHEKTENPKEKYSYEDYVKEKVIEGLK